MSAETDIFARIRAVEFPSLPPEVQQAHLARPNLAIEVVPDGVGFRPAKIEEVNRREPMTLMPKLGVKSWVDTGRLGLIYDDVLLAAVLIPLLQNPTAQQKRLSRAWTEPGAPLHVHLFPYIDFRAMAELRFRVDGGGCRFISAKRRHPDVEPVRLRMAEAMALAERMAGLMPGDDAYLIDIVLPLGAPPRVLEINPMLTRAEAALL